MIPKKIHYCWFGKSNKPETILKYMESWKRNFPEYEIIEWNESNFDVNCCIYTKQAYELKKYAFVSDYARIYILYHIGGIYFDTDLEVCKNFENVLKNHKILLGFEDDYYVLTAFMATEPGIECFENLLKTYERKKFILANGKYDTLPNPIIVTKAMEEMGLIPNGCRQIFSIECEIFPYEYFSGFNISRQKYIVTDNTICIHHCMGTWQTKNDKIKCFIKSILVNIFGEKIFEKLKRAFYKKKL